MSWFKSLIMSIFLSLLTRMLFTQAVTRCLNSRYESGVGTGLNFYRVCMKRGRGDVGENGPAKLSVCVIISLLKEGGRCLSSLASDFLSRFALSWVREGFTVWSSLLWLSRDMSSVISEIICDFTSK